MPRCCYCWNANAALLLLLERECRATAIAGTRMPRYCYCWNANAALLLLLERECRATATAGTRMPRYTATAGTRLPRYCYCYTATLLHRTRKPRYYHYTTAIYCYARNAKAAPLLQKNPQPIELLKTPQRIVCEFKMYMHTPRNPPRRKRYAHHLSMVSRRSSL
jgi:hypothetical protein